MPGAQFTAKQQVDALPGSRAEQPPECPVHHPAAGRQGTSTCRLLAATLAAFGCRFLKDEDLGLSAQPHISPVVRLGHCDSALVLMASDGLWDVVDAEGALGCALQVTVPGAVGSVNVWHRCAMDTTPSLQLLLQGRCRSAAVQAPRLSG